MFYFTSSPWLFRKIYKECVWRIDTAEKNVYLTFDDGPHPEATPYVLDQLKQYNAEATFFCIGKNVSLYPKIYEEILENGHAAGNHTQHHLNGWKTNDKDYLHDISAAKELINSELFRPPYGKITKFQLSLLKGKMQTIMWSNLSGDFDKDITDEDCYLNSIRNPKPGNIIVFHDSEKAFKHLKYALPRTLHFFAEKGYSFKKISLHNNEIY